MRLICSCVAGFCSFLLMRAYEQSLVPSFTVEILVICALLTVMRDD